MFQDTTRINGINKKVYYKKYYQQNKGRYKSKYTKKNFKTELDQINPNRIIKRKMYWYKFLSTNFDHPHTPLIITWSTEENPLILNFN